MNIALILNQQPNPRFLKQINFLSKNHQIFVFYFLRNTNVIVKEVEKPSKVEFIELGSFENQKYLNRFGKTLSALRKISQTLKSIKVDIVLYNHLDVLLIGTIYRWRFRNFNKAVRAIEIGDLREIVFNNSIKGKIYRKFEKFLFRKYIDKLILTSPKFDEYYYSKFFSKERFILENKPLEQFLPKQDVTKTESDKIRIGLIGGLMRGPTTKLLLEYTKIHPEIELRIHGKGKDEVLIRDFAAGCKNVLFYGPFNFFQEAYNIYRNVDLIYAVYHTGNDMDNLKLALPNKLYEAMFFKTPIIVSSGTYVEERVSEKKIGYTMNCDKLEELDLIIRDFSKNRDKFNSAFNAISENEYLGDSDYIKFESFLTS